MSRFHCRGTIECSKCVYYIRAADDNCHRARCTHETNLGSNWLGVTYHDHPDAINWQNKCKRYEEKE